MSRSAFDHSKIVLSAIIPSRKDLLDFAVLQLEESHFPDVTFRNFFSLLKRVGQTSGGVMNRKILGDAISKLTNDRGKLAMYEEMYDTLAETKVEDSDFKWSVDQLKELSAERATADAIARGMEIVNRGVKNDRGEDLYGHSDARSYVLGEFAQIDKDLNKQAMPGGDSREEGKEILREYIERRDNASEFAGIPYGIESIDRLLGGSQPGELILVAAYSNTGKTQFAVQAAWNAAFMNGKNVVYFTSETLRTQIRRRLISRHSRHPKFGLSNGLDSNDIKFTRLSEEEEIIFKAVVDDYSSNPDYGRMVIEQFPQGASVSYVENTLYRYNRDFQIDFCIIDSIPWLQPEKKRPSLRENLVEVVQSSKTLATTFDNGRGIPVLSPWQINRSGYEIAMREHFYSSTALSETAESTNSADIIMTLLKLDEQDERRNSELLGQIVKNRDGVRASSMDLMIDYATSYFYSSTGRGHSDISSLLGSGDEDMFEGML